MWLTKGVDLATVSAWLGHKDLRTTNIYLHYLGTAADEAAIGLINKSLADGPPTLNPDGQGGGDLAEVVQLRAL